MLLVHVQVRPGQSPASTELSVLLVILLTMMFPCEIRRIRETSHSWKRSVGALTVN